MDDKRDSAIFFPYESNNTVLYSCNVVRNQCPLIQLQTRSSSKKTAASTRRSNSHSTCTGTRDMLKGQYRIHCLFSSELGISADTLSPSSKSLDATNASTLSTDVLAIEANNANANTQSSGASQRALTARFSRYFYLPQPPPSHHRVGHIHTVAYTSEHTHNTHTHYTRTAPFFTRHAMMMCVWCSLVYVFFSFVCVQQSKYTKARGNTAAIFGASQDSLCQVFHASTSQNHYGIWFFIFPLIWI